MVVYVSYYTVFCDSAPKAILGRETPSCTKDVYKNWQALITVVHSYILYPTTAYGHLMLNCPLRFCAHNQWCVFKYTISTTDWSSCVQALEGQL